MDKEEEKEREEKEKEKEEPTFCERLVFRQLEGTLKVY